MVNTLAQGHPANPGLWAYLTLTTLHSAFLTFCIPLPWAWVLA